MKTDPSVNSKSQNQAEPRKSRILVVDDHPIVRQGLALLINQEADLVVCGEAEEAIGAMHVLAPRKPTFSSWIFPSTARTASTC